MDPNIYSRHHIEVAGPDAQPMLFAHGFGCDQNMWRYVAPAFKHEFRTVLFDHIGSGQSDLRAYDNERHSTLQGYADDVLEICEALALERIIFVGHSVSCMIGLLASIRRPELFSRLIMISPSPCYVNHLPDYLGGFERPDIEDLLSMMEKNYFGWASFFAPIVMQNGEQPEFTAELEGSFCSTDPNTALRFARTTFFADNRADLPKATVPSLIMQTAEDIIAPAAVGDYLHRHLPNSTLKLMDATGHCPHLSHPAETIATMRQYLHAV